MACDANGPWQRLQRGDATNLAEAIFVKRAASRVALGAMWNSAKLLRTYTKETSVNGGHGLPGLNDVLAAQISLFAFEETVGCSVIITPCAAAAIAEACEWAVSWYHMLFDACRINLSSRTARVLGTIFHMVHSSRCNDGTLPSAVQSAESLSRLHGRMQNVGMEDLVGPIPDLPDFSAHDATAAAQRPFLPAEGTVPGNWLLACCFLKQFCSSLVDDCFEDNELLVDDTSKHKARNVNWRANRWSDGTLKRFLFLRGEAVLRTLQSCPCCEVTLPWTTNAGLGLTGRPQDVFGWTQFGEYAAQSIHTHLVRNQPNLLSLARRQLMPFLDGDDLPASSESTSSTPHVAGSQTWYWKVVAAYVNALKARQWLLEWSNARDNLPADADEAMADEAMSESGDTESSIDDLSEADDLYHEFLQDTLHCESIDAPGAEEEDEDGEGDEEDEDDEDEGEEQYDPDDPEYIPWSLGEDPGLAHET